MRKLLLTRPSFKCAFSIFSGKYDEKARHVLYVHMPYVVSGFFFTKKGVLFWNIKGRAVSRDLMGVTIGVF